MSGLLITTMLTPLVCMFALLALAMFSYHGDYNND